MSTLVTFLLIGSVLCLAVASLIKDEELAMAKGLCLFGAIGAGFLAVLWWWTGGPR